MISVTTNIRQIKNILLLSNQINCFYCGGILKTSRLQQTDVMAFKRFIFIVLVFLSILTFSCESGGGKPVPSDEQKTEARISDSINENLHIDPTPDTYRIRHLYDKQYAYCYRHYGFTSEYQYNEMLFDSNDSLLMQMDTVLEYSTPSNYYNISLKKENVTVSVWRWKDMPDDTKQPIWKS